jgi:hypothetical protein
MEISLADRSLRTRTNCGIKAVVVQIAAMNPISSTIRVLSVITQLREKEADWDVGDLSSILPEKICGNSASRDHDDRSQHLCAHSTCVLCPDISADSSKYH